MRLAECFKTPAVSLPKSSDQRKIGPDHAQELLNKGEKIGQAQEILKTIGFYVKINKETSPHKLCVSDKVQVIIVGRGGYIPPREPTTTCIVWNQ